MSAFDEVQFPPQISFNSTGGPSRQTQVVVLGSGSEARNARWINSRRTYDAAPGVRSIDDIHSIIEFFEARNAQLIGFRFKDWSDYKSCPPGQTPQATDQTIGTGTGTLQTLQLIKKYQSGPSSWTRTISKPVADSVLIAFDGVIQETGWSIDTTTGEITTTASGGAVITAGFEFDTPVRFNTDTLTIDLQKPAASAIQSLPMIELFL